MRLRGGCATGAKSMTRAPRSFFSRTGASPSNSFEGCARDDTAAFTTNNPRRGHSFRYFDANRLALLGRDAAALVRA